MARSARLLALLQALRRRRHPVTAAVLAQELEVSERTIYRDLATLAAEGAPVEGQAGVGYVLRPGLFLPPLMLSEDETEAILLGLRYVDQRGDAVLARAAENARAKLVSVLSANLQALSGAPVATAGPDGRTFSESGAALALLRTAIRAQSRLTLRYTDAEGRPSHRVVWPIQLSFLDDARVLAAWCELRQAFRFFRTDRIQSADPGERYPGRRADLLRALHAQLQASPSRGAPHSHISSSPTFRHPE